MKTHPRATMNLNPERSALLEKLKMKLTKKLGIPVTTTQAMNLAIDALAEREKVR